MTTQKKNKKKTALVWWSLGSPGSLGHRGPHVVWVHLQKKPITFGQNLNAGLDQSTFAPTSPAS
jgi:hypothetical protein